MSAAPRIGGSSVHRILRCPRSARPDPTAPAETVSADARDGTFAHKLAELCLTAGYDAADLVGRLIEQREVTPDFAEPVQVYIDHVRKHFLDKNGQTDLVRAATLRIEQRVELTFFHPQLAGTCDCWVYDPDTQTLHVFDYKHGMGVPVEVENSPQLKFYGLGALLAIDCGVVKVVLHVVQPRCDHPRGPVRSWETTPEDLMEFGFELREAVERSTAPDAPLVPGPWCQFCWRRFNCEALNAVAAEAEAYEKHDAVLAATGGALDPDEMGRRLALLDTLSIWINATRNYAWSEAQRGRIPTGFKLVRIRGKMRFKDPELAMRQAARTFEIDEEKLFKRKPITPRQLSKLVGAKTAAEFLDAHTTVNKSLALAPLSDKREAVAPDAISDFNDLFEEDEDGEA